MTYLLHGCLRCAGDLYGEPDGDGGSVFTCMACGNEHYTKGGAALAVAWQKPELPRRCIHCGSVLAATAFPADRWNRGVCYACKREDTALRAAARRETMTAGQTGVYHTYGGSA